MKRLGYIFLTVLAVSVVGCTSEDKEKKKKKTDKEKALELIDTYMQSFLVSYDSYKPGTIKIDSAYNHPFLYPDVYTSAKNILDAQEKLEDLGWDVRSAEYDYEHLISSESINRIYDHRSKEEKAWDKEKLEKAKKKLEEERENYKKQENIIENNRNAIIEIKNECANSRNFAGWMLTHNYKAENRMGKQMNGQIIVVCDPDFSEIRIALNSNDYELEEQMELIQEILNEESEE